VARWYIKLSALHFDSVGSLYINEAETAITIGPVTSLLVSRRQPPYFHGPFATAKEMYVDQFDTIMRNILNGAHSLPKNRVRDYLLAMEMRMLVSACSELDEGPWYLKHGDDSAEQLLFTEEGELTGIVDWDW
jgi:hypothetical protein